MKNIIKIKIFSLKIILLLFIIIIFSETLIFGYRKIPESLILLPKGVNVVIVEKNTQRIYLYSSNNDLIYQKLNFQCSTGEISGIKLQQGDKKTPEGIYFFTDEYEDKDLTPVYGKKAFPIDYPNFIDKRENRGGSAIWLHGTNKKLKPINSNGCIVMQNKEILQMSQFLALNKTPIILTKKIVYQDKKNLNKQKYEILKMLGNWIKAINEENYNNYIKFYDSNYFPEPKWWTTWQQARKKFKKQELEFLILTDNIGIYREQHVFVLFFDMDVKLLENSMGIGKKKLFLKKQGDTYKIIGDLFQNFSKQKIEKNTSLANAVEKFADNIKTNQEHIKKAVQ